VGRGVAESDDVFHDENPDLKTSMKMTKQRLLATARTQAEMNTRIFDV
jgi:hypothetical protein